MEINEKTGNIFQVRSFAMATSKQLFYFTADRKINYNKSSLVIQNANHVF